MADRNQDIVKFIVFIILDVITLFFSYKLAEKFKKSQQNWMIAIAIIFIPWILTIILFVLKYDFFYIQWIQIGYSIVASISIGYIIWKLNEQNKSDSNQNNELPLLVTSQSQDQIKIRSEPSFKKKLLFQLFPSKTDLDQFKPYNIKWNDYLEYYNHNQKDLDKVFEDLIDQISSKIQQNKNIQQIKFQIFVYTQEMSLLNQIKTIQKSLIDKGKIKEEFQIVRIIDESQDSSNDSINLILSDNKIGHHLVNREMKNILKFNQDLISDYNFKSDCELCFSQFDEQDLGKFFAFTINDLVISQFDPNYKIRDKWNDYVRKFNFLKNSNQVQKEFLNPHLNNLGEFFDINSNIRIRIFKIQPGKTNNLELIEINKGKDKPIDLFLDIDNKQIGFQIIKNQNQDFKSQNNKYDKNQKQENLYDNQKPREAQISLHQVSQSQTPNQMVDQDIHKLESFNKSDKFYNDELQLKNQTNDQTFKNQGELQQLKNQQNYDHKLHENQVKIQQKQINYTDNQQSINVLDDQQLLQNVNTQTVSLTVPPLQKLNENVKDEQQPPQNNNITIIQIDSQKLNNYESETADESQSKENSTNLQQSLQNSIQICRPPQKQNDQGQKAEVQQSKENLSKELKSLANNDLIIQIDGPSQKQIDQDQNAEEKQSKEKPIIELQHLQNANQIGGPPQQQNDQDQNAQKQQTKKKPTEEYQLQQIANQIERQLYQGQNAEEQQSKENFTEEQQALANNDTIFQIDGPPQKQIDQGQNAEEKQSKENFREEQYLLQNVKNFTIIQIDGPPQQQNYQIQNVEELQQKENFTNELLPLENANQIAGPPQQQNDQIQNVEEVQSNNDTIILIDGPPSKQNYQDLNAKEKQSLQKLINEQLALQNAIQIEEPPYQGQIAEEQQSKEKHTEEQQALDNKDTIIQIDSPPQKQNGPPQYQNYQVQNAKEEQQSKGKHTEEQQALTNKESIIQIDNPPQKQNGPPQYQNYQGQNAKEEQSKDNFTNDTIIQKDGPPQKQDGPPQQQNYQGQNSEEQQSKENFTEEKQFLDTNDAIIQKVGPPQKQNDKGQNDEEKQSNEKLTNELPLHNVNQIGGPPQQQNDQGENVEEQKSKENFREEQQPLQNSNNEIIIQISGPPQYKNYQGYKTEEQQAIESITEQQNQVLNTNNQATIFVDHQNNIAEVIQNQTQQQIISQFNDDVKQTYDQILQSENMQNGRQNQTHQVDYSYPIVNEKFYIPSFKQRQVDDDYLKKFIRDLKNIQEYQHEYNLDGSQQEIFTNQIKFFIPIRGDGNCLFTSIGYQYMYYNIIDAQRYERLQSIIDSMEFKQNYEDKSIETQEDQDILRQEFKIYLQRLINIQDTYQLLQQLALYINNYDGPFYGLLIIFMRNYFRKILQDCYDTNEEMNFYIQKPDQINEIITWEFMYDETDIALKLFAAQEQILVRSYSKMNVNDKIVQISEYKNDDQNLIQYKIGLAFQPGHYNAILLND